MDRRGRCDGGRHQSRAALENTQAEELRMKRTAIFTAAVLGSIGLAFRIGVAVGEQAPTENRGVNVSPPTALELAPEVEGVDGRQLRMRVVTIEPGGVAAVHSHKGRPAVAYVMQGTLTEHREGGWVKERQTGESFVETKEVTHWAENKGSQPVVILAVDVFKP
jgi:quercetin dioxygenase-like cupin family protein